MSDDLVQRVGRWLDAVPHSPTCRLVAPSPTYAFGYCDCDRAQRQAEAVVRLAHEVAVEANVWPLGTLRDDVSARELAIKFTVYRLEGETLERQEPAR